MHKNAPLTAPGEPKFSAFYQTSSLKKQGELILQALWQIYLPKHIPRPKFDVSTPNAVHQADPLFLPHDAVGHGGGRKNILTRFDRGRPWSAGSKKLNPWPRKTLLKSPALSKIYTRGPLRLPQLLQCGPGARLHGRSHQRDGKTQKKNSQWACHNRPEPRF